MEDINQILHYVLNKMRQLIFRKRLRYITEGSAVSYNSIDNVDSLNESYIHWLNSLKSDKKFINSIYNDIIAICNIDEDTKVADFGCGTGVLVNRLKNEFPNMHIVGYDFSENKIRWCQRFYCINPLCFSHGSIFEPINNKYDVIIATEVLEHLEYPLRALKNLMSALDVGGRLFLTVPDGRRDAFHGHIHFWSPESWTLFINEAVQHPNDVKIGMLSGKNYALIQGKVK